LENIIKQLKEGNFEIKLTNEKLFISTATANETFALRSINGIGVVDLVNKYNNDLSDWKSKQTEVWARFMSYGTCLAIFGIVMYLLDEKWFGILCITIALALFYIAYYNKNKIKGNKPRLKSAVRIMMSSGNRDFAFYKSSKVSEAVAGFVVEVEKSLTAYHKNNL
jgi:hypothetical protein